MKTANLKQLLLLLVLTSVSRYLFGQVDPQIVWQKTIRADVHDKAVSINQTADGGYIIGSVSNSNSMADKTENSNGGNDYWIIKTDNIGSIVWQNTIGGNEDDVLYSVEQTSDGGYIAIGASNSNISGDKTEDSIGLKDIWIVKLSSAGTILWENTIGGTSFDRGVTVRQTSDGGYIVGAVSKSIISGDKTDFCYGGVDYWVLKLDVTGVITWQKTYGGSDADILSSIYPTSDGGYIIGGTSRSLISGNKTENSFGDDDYWIIKVDALGAIVWQKSIGGSNADRLKSIFEIPSGEYVMGGTSWSGISGLKTENSYGFNDYWILKINTTGTILWQHTIGGFESDLLSSINKNLTGGYILAGSSNSPISGNKTAANLTGSGTAMYEDEWIVALEEDGSIIWDNAIGSVYTDNAASIIPTSDGEYIVLGQTNSIASYDLTSGAYASYDLWITKLRSPSHTIHGNITSDFNLNCIYDTIVDGVVANKIILDAYSSASGFSSATGDYTINTYSDSALLFISNLNTNEYVSCMPSDSIFITFDSTSSIDTSNVNFLLHGDMCSNLNVTLSSSLAAPCRGINYTINYANSGFDSAYNAVVYVNIDTSVLTSITSTSPFILSGDSLLFPLGTVAPYYSGVINFSAIVSCTAVIGTSICTRAYCFPISNCPPPTAYDSSDIIVELNCIGDSVHAIIQNRIGARAMTSPGIITVIEDEIIQSASPFILSSGATTTVDKLIGIDKTFTLKITQHPDHPQRPTIIVQDELCALTAPIKINTVINHFSRYDEANAYDESCIRILASFDPNLKSVTPEGYSSQHYTDSNQVLEYRIDFQNTGLDTARKVVIIDTLSPWLDINTIVPLVSSHSFTTKLVGTNILSFIFDPIALPDSNVSEPTSHGYVTFNIRPKFNTPKGTVVDNFADIYFDFNAPVRTNTVFNTIFDTVIVRLGVGLNEPKENLESHVLVFPNPTIDKFYLQLDQDVKDVQIKLVDASGREVYEMNQVNGNIIEMTAVNLSKGIYFIQVYEANKLLGKTKVVVQK